MAGATLGGETESVREERRWMDRGDRKKQRHAKTGDQPCVEYTLSSVCTREICWQEEVHL